MPRLAILAVSFLAVAVLACSSQQKPGAVTQAMQEQWITQARSDGGILVRLKPGAELDPEIYGEYSKTNLSRAVEEAARSQIDMQFREGFRDIRVSIEDDGIVKVTGSLESEVEAVRVINAALGVQGVRAVISYLHYPGRPTYGYRASLTRPRVIEP